MNKASVSPFRKNTTTSKYGSYCNEDTTVRISLQTLLKVLYHAHYHFIVRNKTNSQKISFLPDKYFLLDSKFSILI